MIRSVPENPRCISLSLLTLFLMIYFSDDSTNSPFIKALNNLPESFLPTLNEAIRRDIRNPLSVVLLYTFLVFSKRFASFCVSCVDQRWVAVLANEISSSSPELADLQLSSLLILTGDSQFSNAISSQPFLTWRILPPLLDFANRYCTEESRQQPVTTALSVAVNLARRISDFSQENAELFFRIVAKCLRIEGNSGEEFLILLMLFVESICIKRARWNLSLIYSLLRHSDLIEEVEKRVHDSPRFEKPMKNLKVMISAMLGRVKGKDSAEGTMRCLRDAVENWFPTGKLEEGPEAAFTFVTYEFRESVKFFRGLLIKEIQEVI
jgi:hypothetical protein